MPLFEFLETVDMWLMVVTGWLVMTFFLWLGYRDATTFTNVNRPLLRACVFSTILMVIALIMSYSIVASKGV